MNYERAEQLLETARNKDRGKPIANNTRLFARENGKIAIRLHSTDVIVMSPDGSFCLDSGGWQTCTTKARMNGDAPARIHSDRGIWYVSYQGKQYPYADGIILRPDGTVEGAGEDPKAAIKLRKQCAKYAKDYVQALSEGKIPAPSNGDCWGCVMRTPDNHKGMGGADHIISHFDERYFVPSLLASAIKSFPVSQVALRYIGSFWGASAMEEQKKSARGFSDELARGQLIKSVKRFCQRELGLAT